jgi:hypothetical protein
MTALRFIAIMLTMSLTTVAAASEFDGSVPLQCTADKGHDCLPGENECTRLKPQTDIAPIFGIDVAKKEIRSPFRTALLPILYTTTNQESVVLQGADLQFAWSALINKTTGALTVTIADRKGAYVAFGQCKVAAAK